jgi:flagellar biosynthetic protein FliR
VAFQRSYHFLPIGGAGLNEETALEVIGRTSYLFVFAVQVAAPLIAVSFVIVLVFSVIGRAVPQMNVFMESFGVRVMAGLIVLGLTFQLMAQHIANFLRRLPQDILQVAQLLGLP